MTRYRAIKLGSHASLIALAWAATSAGAPALRQQVDINGDFVLFGNTLGFDCGSGVPAPVVGTANCATGVTNATDDAIDIYWRSDSPSAGSATAAANVTMANARSTALLQMPVGAALSIKYARLYWAAFQSGTGQGDQTATVEFPSSSTALNVTADATWTTAIPSFNNLSWYQSSADITDFVIQNGAGAYRVSGVSSYANLASYNNNNTMAGWAIVVFYERAGDPARNLALFDGLDAVGPGASLSTTLNGFLVPDSGFKARLGVVAYEGDDVYAGDHFSFNGHRLSDAFNPEDNFFNSTYSYLGASASKVGDLPQLTGAARSMGGLDIDVVDVTSYLQKRDTSATIGADTNNDRYVLGAFVTSISTFKPSFATSGKTVSKVTPGPLRPGSELEYTVAVTNTGNDESTNTVMTDALPAQISYVPGSLQVVSTSTSLSDAAGDDQGEYNAATRTITVRVGTGANASQGGLVAIGETTLVRFRVTLNGDAAGVIQNQAIITSEGKLGAPSTDFPTDGNGSDDGVPSTDIPVDQCSSNSNCSAPTPICDTSASPATCVGCVFASDCSNNLKCDLATHACYCPSDDPSCVDHDSDGLTDVVERGLGTDPYDADSDDDGVADGSELRPGEDTDGDGLINALDPDSDNDGLFDGTELGYHNCATQPGTDLTKHRCVDDQDPKTTTSPIDADTDDGGISDGSEDANLNGAVDGAETDPNFRDDDTAVVDSDSDGLSDALEGYIHSDPNDPDTDHDGVYDGPSLRNGQLILGEANPTDDTDGDGLINVLDYDSDDDGLFDGTEMGRDCSSLLPNVSTAHCIADGDNGQHKTSPLIADTDRGSLSDGQEDRNHNGLKDADERDPLIGEDDQSNCTADADCGGLTSGIVCDETYWNYCVHGCRGTGGNGCPENGPSCSSSSNTIGSCSGQTGTGGSSSTGGSPSIGGAAATGGSSASAGTANAGGSDNIASGGISGIGGSTPVGSIEMAGGTSGIGGAGSLALGGMPSVGGSAAQGGTSSIITGTASTGLDAGFAETGGMLGTGGSSLDAGPVTTGGSAPVISTAVADTGTSLEGGGCSCTVAGHRRSTGVWLAACMGAVLLLRRRRSR